MKYLKNSFLFIAIIVLVSSAFTSVNAGGLDNKFMIVQNDTTQNNTVTYEVFGMDCPGCQSALEKQVEKIDGVADAKASFVEKEVVIKLKPGAKVEDKEIEERIKKANFTPGKKINAAQNEE